VLFRIFAGKSLIISAVILQRIKALNPWHRGLIFLGIFSSYLSLWGLSNGRRSEYYAAIATSMSKSWSNLFFGVLEPGGSVTLDKIPGSYWIPAIFVKIFGFSTWSVDAPNAIAMVLFVLVVAFTIKPRFGTSAGLIAGFIAATTPIVVAVGRSNQPQTFFLLTLAIAANRVVIALENNSRKTLIQAGALVALAFHTYMLVAWAIWPAIICAWWFTKQSRKKKVFDLLSAGSVSLILSNIWLIIVALVPASKRPYIGGTYNNNPYEMVFGYNGLGRFSTTKTLSTTSDELLFRTFTPPFSGKPSIFRLFNDQVAGQIAWLLPLAFISLAIAFWFNKERPAVIFLGTWLITYSSMFSLVAGMHQFYVSALTMPMAGLIGFAISDLIDSGKFRILAGLILANLIWALFLVNRYSEYKSWSIMIQAAIGILAIYILWSKNFGSNQSNRYVLPVSIILALGFVPSVWSQDVMNHPNSINPIAGPDQKNNFGGGRPNANGVPPMRPNSLPQGLYPDLAQMPPDGMNLGMPPGMMPGISPNISNSVKNQNESLIKYLKANREKSKYLLVTFGAQTAATFITSTGEPVLPVGGFDGQDPTPTLEQFQKLVKNGEIKFVLDTWQPKKVSGGAAVGGTSKLLKSVNTSSKIANWVKQNCYLDAQSPSPTPLYVCSSAL
jgi:4-amino-4-deoxy-L-arabinose transferase-like glycosyltransferase